MKRSMPRRTHFAKLLCLVLLSACQISETQPPNPTPTQPTCAVEGLLGYRDEQGGYCFAYPAEYALDERGIVGPPLDESINPLWVSFFVEIQANENEADLDQIVRDYLAPHASPDYSIIQTQTEVGGEPAAMLYGIPGLPTFRLILLLHNDQLYLLHLLPEPTQWPTAQRQAEALLGSILSTFQFLD